MKTNNKNIPNGTLCLYTGEDEEEMAIVLFYNADKDKRYEGFILQLIETKEHVCSFEDNFTPICLINNN